jgi:hypothetical protein
VTLLKVTDACVQVPNIFYLPVSFKFLNFRLNILFLFVREMFASFTWSYNKVRELAAVCLPWQHWTKALVWFDDVDISVFRNCFVVVDLWQSLSEWHLLLSVCALV